MTAGFSKALEKISLNSIIQRKHFNSLNLLRPRDEYRIADALILDKTKTVAENWDSKAPFVGTILAYLDFMSSKKLQISSIVDLNCFSSFNPLE